VMDGSRRSAHGNAYFTGLGRAKRIVFFDTLIERLAPAEIEAVLAHELGHFKLRHIAKRMAFSFGMSFFALALLGWLAQQPWFYLGLGVEPALDGRNDGLALLLFMLVEFEADAYAVAHTDGKDLASALLKLYKDNASTLTPDPVYARFYYSHPPASERLARLQPATA